MVLAPITVELMRAVDRLMVDDYGITLVQMMENAGRSLAALTRMLHGGDTASARVLALVGGSPPRGTWPTPERMCGRRLWRHRRCRARCPNASGPRYRPWV